MTKGREHRLDVLKREYEDRFRGICRDMSPDDFANLVDEMARFRLKYEDLEAERRADPLRRPPRS